MGDKIRKDLNARCENGSIVQRITVVERFRTGFSERPSACLMAVLFVTSVIVYFNAVFDGFVYDDRLQILRNPWIKDIRYIPDLFIKSVWSFQANTGISNYFRPIMYIIYMFDYHVFGLHPWGYHVVNILFHATASSVVFMLTLKLLRENTSLPEISCLFPSFVASMFFAVDPIHTEAVTWVAAIPELSFTLFYLLAFYFYMRSEDDGSGKRAYLLSVAMFAVSALCKETALTFPMILVAYDYGLKKDRGPLAASLKRYLPYLIVAGVYLAMRIHALGGIAPETVHAGLDTCHLAINVVCLFKQYLAKLLFPINLDLFHVFRPPGSVFDPEGMLSLGVLIVYSAAVVLAKRKNTLVYFSLLFVVIPLLPAFYIPALGENVFAERYLYLPSVGLAILLALSVAWIRTSFAGRKAVWNPVFALLIGLCCIATISRNAVWKDEYTLFVDTLLKSPHGVVQPWSLPIDLSSRRAADHYNLGVAYLKGGMTDKAIEQFRIAGLAHGFAEPHNDLGYIYAKKGLLDKAIEQFRIAVTLKPAYATAHHNLGEAYEQEGLIDKAVEQFEIAVRLAPDNDQFRSDLAGAMKK